MVEARAPPVKQPEITENTKEKLTGLKINNLPKNISEEEVLEFLKENVQKDLDVVNYELTPHKTTNNSYFLLSVLMFVGFKRLDAIYSDFYIYESIIS